ncbi:LysR family transcriptional regulator [Paenibacillus athensensis]|uniref:LysR family transcriptional regulator n=1 Tax=Paenibacillus athensensis TaxID=1967502 RepID=A0A4Y8PTS1_9BACL|nr:LysR substrate-binding domain-containing protein [Paenibacillus athensensis]MCD1261781.1 LysR family transcriptional regulator [Paenibacillus athensensis]
MELSALKCFQTVARMEHMTQAAEVLHLAQPALSRTIRQLETELGVQLFDRIGRKLRLNEYGARFLLKVDTALSTLEEGRLELRDLAERPSGTVTLYVQVASHLIPELICSFREQYPEVEFKLLQQDPVNGAPLVFDLCLTTAPCAIPDTVSEQLLTEDIVLAVPAGHPLAHRSALQLSELRGEGWISLRPGRRLRETTDALCRQAGFAPRILYECDEPSMVRGLVRAGLGVSFIPAITWSGSQGSAVTLIPIEDARCARTIDLVWHPNRYMTKAAAAFRDFARSYFRQLR